MNTAKTHCIFCAEHLVLPAPQVLLTVHTCQKWRDTWTYLCTACGQENVKTADQTTIEMLVSIGVPLRRVHIPAEADEPHTGPAITWDDVLDFTTALTASEERSARRFSS